MALVLKTSEVQASAGSNPALSVFSWSQGGPSGPRESQDRLVSLTFDGISVPGRPTRFQSIWGTNRGTRNRCPPGRHGIETPMSDSSVKELKAQQKSSLLIARTKELSEIEHTFKAVELSSVHVKRPKTVADKY